MRIAGLEYGRKIREFATLEEATEWKERNKHRLGKIGKYKGKKIYSLKNLTKKFTAWREP